MEFILNIIKCPICEFTLNSPIILPCGHSICKWHASDNDDKSIKCVKCLDEHSIPSNGFPQNQTLIDLIDAEIEQLDFGETYKKAKLGCRNLDILHDEIESLIRDPSFFAYQKVNDLKNKVNIKREELKLLIDEETDLLLDKLSKYETECKECLTTNEFIGNSASLNISLKKSQMKLKSSIVYLNK